MLGWFRCKLAGRSIDVDVVPKKFLYTTNAFGARTLCFRPISTHAFYYIPRNMVVRIVTENNNIICSMLNILKNTPCHFSPEAPKTKGTFIIGMVHAYHEFDDGILTRRML